MGSLKQPWWVWAMFAVGLLLLRDFVVTVAYEAIYVVTGHRYR